MREMIGPRALVFQPVVEENEALETRLNRDLFKAHGFFLLYWACAIELEAGNFQGLLVLECWSRGMKNPGSRFKWSLVTEGHLLFFISLQPRLFTDYQWEQSGFWQVLWSHDWKDSSCIWKIGRDKIPLRRQYSKQRISNGVFICCATL